MRRPHFIVSPEIVALVVILFFVGSALTMCGPAA